MGDPFVQKQKAPCTPVIRSASYRSFGTSLGLSAERAQELIRKLQEGFPFKAWETFSARSGIPVADFHKLIPGKTDPIRV
jgi:hypothetical protein